jgi:hypothetical protein
MMTTTASIPAPTPPGSTTDSDGYGVSSAVAEQCSPPEGYVAEDGDCDDEDEDRFPGQRWHADQDGDEFGDSADAFASCLPPDGFLADGSDCDDTDPLVQPDAAEVCDLADNDCDGLIDDDDDSVDASSYSSWFRDDDGDGYGDSAVPAARCEPPAGFVDLSGDCDDSTGLISPGADEICDNGIDDDCDMLAWPCGFAGDNVPSDASAILSSTGGNLGYDVAVGDINGDGRLDVALPAYASAGGVVYLTLGPVSADMDVSASADARLSGGADFDYAGRSLDLGDLDGDGYDDIAVGAYGQDDGGSLSGAAYVVYGAASLSGDLDLDDDAALTWRGDAGDLLGSVVRFLGDINGDGLDDLALGAAGIDDSAGAVFIVLGGTAVGDDEVDASLSIDEDGAQLGGERSLSRGGDLDGDGLDDLVVSAAGSSGAGTAWLLYGSTSFGRDIDLDDADASFTGSDAHDNLGSAVAAGDFDGDGYDDLALAAASADPVSHNEGAVYILAGGAVRRQGTDDAADTADSTLRGAAPSDYAGAALAAADLDQDGQHDLLIGATGVDNKTSSSANAGYLLYGPFSGDSSVADADASITGDSSYAFTGQALAAGDINHDGLTDAIISSYGADQAYIFFGGGL